MFRIFMISIAFVNVMAFTTGCGNDSFSENDKMEISSMNNQTDSQVEQDSTARSYLKMPFNTIDGKVSSLANFNTKGHESFQ